MLVIRNLYKLYGEGPNAVEAIRDVSLEVQQGSFVSIVGPSGCGKTTLLKCIAGLYQPTSGEVVLHNRRITGPPAQMAVVFQEYNRSLFPWMTVAANVAAPLVSRGTDRRKRREAAARSIASVGLEGFERSYPWQLSGGMQQRVAIARALVCEPEILLMDEPFASVDAQARADLEDLILNVHGDLGVTVLFVTHDIDESVYLSDRVVVLSRRPTCIDKIVDVQLPRPRHQVATKELPEYARLRGEVYLRIKRPPTPVDAAGAASLDPSMGVADRSALADSAETPSVTREPAARWRVSGPEQVES